MKPVIFKTDALPAGRAVLPSRAGAFANFLHDRECRTAGSVIGG
jgi:hypothetical protein